MVTPEHANEAIRKQWPDPGFRWQITIDPNGQIGSPIADSGRIFGRVGDEAKIYARSLVAEQAVDGEPQNGKHVVRCVNDKAPRKSVRHKRTLGLEGCASCGHDVMDLVFEGERPRGRYHASAGPDQDRVRQAFPDAPQGVTHRRRRKTHPPCGSGYAAFLEQGVEGNEQAEVRGLHGKGLLWRATSSGNSCRSRKYSGSPIGSANPLWVCSSSSLLLGYMLKIVYSHSEMDRETRLNLVFAALADPTRRAMLRVLAEGDATVAELAAPFGLKQPTISKHLRVLELAGLIRRGRDAQRRPRTLVIGGPLKLVDEWMGPFRDLWHQRFDQLEVLLDAGPRADAKNKAS